MNGCPGLLGRVSKMDDMITMRCTLTLYATNPIHVRARQILDKIPKGQRTEHICRLLTAHERSKRLETIVYDAVLKALKEHGSVAVTQNNSKGSDEADEVEKNFYGFLSTLQVKGDGKH